jgi:hypothetical protein
MTEKQQKNSVSQRKRRTKLKQVIIDMGCAVCSEEHPGVLEVHHLAQEYKRYGRSQDLMYNIQDLNDKKAIVLCSNCHNKFHWHFGGKNQPFGIHTIQSVIDIINKEAL